MKQNRFLNILSFTVMVLASFAAAVGVFYSTSGARFIVKNIYGQNIELYGDGIYAFNSVMKAATSKGTDMVILLFIPMLLIVTILRGKSKKAEFLHAGLLGCFLYYSASLCFGVSYNRLFPVYLLLFSSSLFGFILAFKNVFTQDNLSQDLKNVTLIGTAVFMIIAGCSVLIWLTFIIPAAISGSPISTIEIYTTEPTFIFDLGIIFPAALVCAVKLLKRRKLGYKLVPVLLTLLMMVGLCVIGQTMVQLKMGIKLPMPQMIGMVGSFVILGYAATLLNVRFLKYIE